MLSSLPEAGIYKYVRYGLEQKICAEALIYVARAEGLIDLTCADTQECLARAEARGPIKEKPDSK